MKLRYSIIIALVFTTLQLSAQSPWTKKQGEGFFKLSEMIIVSDQFYSPEGSIQDIKTAGVYITGLYGEYGLTDRLNVVGFVPFFVRNTIHEQEFAISPNNEPGDESNSFGDVDLGFNYGIKQDGPFVLSASLLFGIPSGETSGGNTEILQSGDGEFNQLIRLHAGYSFYPAPFYATTSVGFNNRTNGFSDEFRFSLEFGAAIKQNLFAALKFGILESFNNGDATASQTGIFSNNTEYVTFGPEVNYFIGKGFGVSASVFGAFSGQNILASPAFTLGLVYDLKRK